MPCASLHLSRRSRTVRPDGAYSYRHAAAVERSVASEFETFKFGSVHVNQHLLSYLARLIVTKGKTQEKEI